jgi:hypothetical protein
MIRSYAPRSFQEFWETKGGRSATQGLLVLVAAQLPRTQTGRQQWGSSFVSDHPLHPAVSDFYFSIGSCDRK